MFDWNKILLIFMIIFFSISRAHTENDKSLFCKKFSTTESKAKLIESLLNFSNRLNFTNGDFGLPKSLFPSKEGYGICWWHSRFQRAATYLAYYSPKKSRPTEMQAQSIIKSIVRMSKVVEIPGFRNLDEFSEKYKDFIIEELEIWQIRESYKSAMRSINPLFPSFYSYDSNLHHTFERLNHLVNVDKVIPFVIEQLPGIDAHSYLVIKVDTLKYDPWKGTMVLTLVDSAYMNLIRVVIDPETKNRIRVLEPNNELGKATNAIYIDFSRDLRKIERSLRAFCPEYRLKVKPSKIYYVEY